MKEKIGIVAPFVCALGLLLSGCEQKSSGPAGDNKPLDVSKAAANTLETSAPRISFATVDYDRARPNFVAPCFFVIKGIRNAALANDKFVIEYKLTYMSGGRQVTKNVTTRLSKSLEHEHESNPDSKAYIALADQIDVSDLPPDAGTTFTGSATLLKENGNTRSEEGSFVLGGGQ